MIYGIGVDICDVERIAAVLQRQGERFVRRVLGAAEQATYQQYAQQLPQRAVHYLAARFAAKEALAKATGLGMSAPMGWQACEVLNRSTGQPFVQVHGDLQHWFAAQQVRAHISLSDEKKYVSAFAVLEYVMPNP